MPVAVYQFGEFTLHSATFELSRNGRRLRLERKPLELLLLLVRRHGEVVTREEIAQHLWEQAVFVDVEHGINTAIRKIRQVLGDSSDLPRFVQTLSGSGYRFIAAVATVEPAILAPTPPPYSATEPIAEAALVPVPEAYASPITPPLVSPDRATKLIAGLGALALIAAAALILGPHPLVTRFIPQRPHVPLGSIAVLPLQNLSGDPSQQYFADGMTDELTTELARIPNLRVVSRTSVMASERPVRSLPDIARQLDVDAIVEGSTVRSGNRIRITAQLIDARTDRHLWAQSFEGQAADVLALQDSVARQIAGQASLILAPTPPRPPMDPAAHDAYLRGRYFFNKQDYAHCLAYFKQAVLLAPNYAPAQAGYASALDAATTYQLGTPSQLMPQALAAARRAIQLDPQNGEAYTALGSVQTIYEWNWDEASENLLRGISLSPNDAIAEFKYSVYLDAVGRREEAVIHMRRALQLDPLSFLVTLRLGVALYYDHQYDAALAQLQRAAEMEQSSISPVYYMSLIYAQTNDRDQAVHQDLQALRDARPPIDTAALLSIYQQHGWEPYWRARTSALLPASASPCTAYQVGVDDLRIHEPGPAFKAFELALDHHCFNIVFLRVDPLFDSFRHDARYLALLEQMHQ